MQKEMRAAQFAPFAALTGYGSAVSEAARLTEARIELDEAEKEILDRTLRELEQEKDREVCITYFCPDERKSGGAYISTVGTIQKFDRLNAAICLNNGTEIPMEEILRIEYP